MDPSNKENGGLPLPAPPPEQTPIASVAGASEGLPGSAEQLLGAEIVSQPPVAPPLSTIPLPMLPQALPPAAPPSDNAAAVTPTSALLADDDNDLIEKEWVNKAKQIVEHNRDDPYKQSEDLTIFKADYIKKRYGKTIKVSQ